MADINFEDIQPFVEGQGDTGKTAREKINRNFAKVSEKLHDATSDITDLKENVSDNSNDLRDVKEALLKSSSSISSRHAILERGSINGNFNTNISYDTSVANTIRLRSVGKFEITSSTVKVIARSVSGQYKPSVVLYNGCDSEDNATSLNGSSNYVMNSEVENAVIGAYVRFVIKIKDSDNEDVTEITDAILNDIYVSGEGSEGVLFNSSNSTLIDTEDNEYYNVGEIAEQVSENTESIEKIKPLTKGKTVGSDILTIDGYGINYLTGKLSQYSNWHASEYIHIQSGSTLKIKGAPGTNFGLAFYSSNNELSYISGTNTYNKNDYTDVDVPENANYFRVGCYADLDKFSIIYIQLAIEDVANKIVSLTKTVGEMNIVNGGNTSIELDNSLLTIDGYGIRFADGKSSPYNGWAATDFIKIQDGENRIMKIRSTAGNNFGIAFYSSNNELSYISGTKYYDGEHTYNTQNYYDIPIPDNASYLRTCCMTSSTYFNAFGLILPFAVKSYLNAVIQIEENSTSIDEIKENINEENKALSGSSLAGGKTYMSSTNKIMLTGASLAYNANGWFENACNWLGVTGINKAISGTRIGQFAKRLYDNDYISSTEVEETEILVFNHVHNKDVYTLPTSYIDYSVEDYEAEADTNFLSNGGDTSDETYAKAFDYVIKKWIKMNEDLKDNPNSAYYQTPFGRPVKILLCTYWHDGRVKYNTSIRKLANKWGFPLVKFDEEIGLSCKVMSGRCKTDSDVIVPDLMQFSLANGEGMSNRDLCVIDGVQYNAEIIDGKIVPWHYARGTSLEIQKRLAAILKNMIEIV